jgi:hypothetical protein
MDLEGIYMAPFGAVESSSVLPGDGGRYCRRMLKLPGMSTGSRSLTIADGQSRKLLAGHGTFLLVSFGPARAPSLPVC